MFFIPGNAVVTCISRRSPMNITIANVSRSLPVCMEPTLCFYSARQDSFWPNPCMPCVISKLVPRQSATITKLWPGFSRVDRHVPDCFHFRVAPVNRGLIKAVACLCRAGRGAVNVSLVSGAGPRAGPAASAAGTVLREPRT